MHWATVKRGEVGMGLTVLTCMRPAVPLLGESGGGLGSRGVVIH
jgi:hypothetical protein